MPTRFKQGKGTQLNDSAGNGATDGTKTLLSLHCAGPKLSNWQASPVVYTRTWLSTCNLWSSVVCLTGTTDTQRAVHNCQCSDKYIGRTTFFRCNLKCWAVSLTATSLWLFLSLATLVPFSLFLKTTYSISLFQKHTFLKKGPITKYKLHFDELDTILYPRSKNEFWLK